MAPTIRIDDDVWTWLQSQARPFEDTPNSVLRRVAGLEQGVAQTEREATPKLRRVSERGLGKKTPQRDFRRPILAILLRHGGRGDRTMVLRELDQVLGSRLTEFDRQDIKSGTIRWQKSAEWEVSTMRQEGLLLPSTASPYGVWVLSDEGRRLAQLP